MNGLDWVWAALTVLLLLAVVVGVRLEQYRQTCRCGHHLSSHGGAPLACGGITGRRRLANGELFYDICRCDRFRQ